MKSISRLLILLGAGGVVLATVVPWASVRGPLSLDLLNVDADPGGRTVSGTDTPAWPVLLAIAGVIVALVLLNKLRKLIMLFGGLIVLAGAGLLYYVTNAVEIETEGDEIKGTIGRLAFSTDTKLGPYLLIASGALMLIGTARAFND
jgi:hypothetical protein